MKKIICLFLTIVCCFTLCGCREVYRVQYNIQKEADNFNVCRRLTVMNARTDTVMLQLEGRFSLQNNTSNELVIVLETDKDTYRQDYIYLTDNVLYVVENIDESDVSPYHYELNFLPQMIPLTTITVNK